MSSMKIGYARTARAGGSLQRQIDALLASGCTQVFSEVAGGMTEAHRPEWDKCIASLRAGDTLCVTELVRLWRHQPNLARVLDRLDALGVTLSILDGTPVDLLKRELLLAW
jgi:DNA invertase Pin-like site-specific DNA recombinase